jgi:drug/metabolite transporter (DMT)-like permease
MWNKLSNNTRGIICIILAALGFSLMTFFVRLSGDVPTMEKAFFRNAFAAVVSFILLKKEGEKFRIKKGNGRDIFFRCLFGTSGLIANFYAIDKIGIADANMLNKLSPFFAILLSIPILKERPKRIDVLTTLVAFLGAVLIVRPGSGISNAVPALVGLYGGFGAGFAYVFVRKLGGKGEKTPIIVLCFSLFSCLVCIPFIIPVFIMPTIKQLFLLILAGLAATLGQFGITSAYKFAPAKEISVFDYTQVVFAALLGILFLHEIPVPLSIVGYVIIIGMAVFRWKYNLSQEKKTTTGV